MAYVYVLRSLKTSKQYIGSTTWEPEARLREHKMDRLATTMNFRKRAEEIKKTSS